VLVTFLEGELLLSDDHVGLVWEVQSKQLESLLEVEVLEISLELKDHSFSVFI
jgi:hypothetical protein